MSSKSLAVLFLGSGATAGSGLRKNERCLPADAGLFSSGLVRKCLEGDFPTIRLLRKRSGFADEVSLYQTWNRLFVYRGLARAGVIREAPQVIDEFNKLANYPWHSVRRAEHYRHQFQIMGREPREYYLAELAVWDLRVLIKDVFEVPDKSDCVYPTFFNRLRQSADVSAVVNLNYDSTFDEAFDPEGYYHPGDSRPGGGSRWPLIRPHGSLKWTSRGTWSLHASRFVGWTDSWEGTDPSNWGYKAIPGASDHLELRQALIVTPAMTKEEVVGNSSMPGLGNNILLWQWTAVETVLRQSACWIFVGLSLSSGDDHLVFLLNRALQERDGATDIHCSCYDNQHVCARLECLLRTPVCCHPIPKGHTIDSFLFGGSPCTLGS